MNESGIQLFYEIFTTFKIYISPFLYPQYLHLLKFAHPHLAQLKQKKNFMEIHCTGTVSVMETKKVVVTNISKLQTIKTNLQASFKVMITEEPSWKTQRNTKLISLNYLMCNISSSNIQWCWGKTVLESKLTTAWRSSSTQLVSEYRNFCSPYLHVLYFNVVVTSSKASDYSGYYAGLSFFQLVSGRNSTNLAIWLVPGAGGILLYGPQQWEESIELIYVREWISGYRQSFALP